MTEPTYRIDTEHNPRFIGGIYEWEAKVRRLSDGFAVATVNGFTEQKAIDLAYEVIRNIASGQQDGSTVYADENGAPVVEPQSVKA